MFQLFNHFGQLAVGLVAVVCVYTQDCPQGQICHTDEIGRGVCATGNASEEATGRAGENCTWNMDCQDGMICQRESIGKIGICQPGARK